MFCHSVGVKNQNSKEEQSAHPPKRQPLILNVLNFLSSRYLFVLCSFYFSNSSNGNKYLSCNAT